MAGSRSSIIDDAFFVFQRRLGLQEKSSRLSSSSTVGSRLLYAATVLVLASLLTPVACLVLGFARYAARRQIDEIGRYMQTSGYERIDSVSSIVDSQRRDQQLCQDVADMEEMTVI